MIVLAIIIVAIAIAISIQLFRSNAIEHKRDLLINECSYIATIALNYYKKPSEIGGGGQTFTGWEVPNSMNATENGTYIAVVSRDRVVITGTGTEVVTGNDSIKIQTIVTGNSLYSEVIN